MSALEPEHLSPEERVAAIAAICRRPGRILILMQDQPDPDALACAKALRKLIQHTTRKRAVIGYGGVCGRAENKAMMKVLRIDARHITSGNIDDFKTICLVDTQPGSGNNLLGKSRSAQIVIDHHNLPKRRPWHAEYADVRPDYGACSTILYEYLQAEDVKMNSNLTTALFYGIQSDTQDLGREASPDGVRAYQELFQIANKKKLAQIRRAPVPPDYFQAIEASLSNCEVAGNAIITRVPRCESPEILAEVAELLLRLDGVRCAIAYGLCDGVIYLSARAPDSRGHVDRRIKRIVFRIGTGGGHSAMAGGQIPANGNPESKLELVRKRILHVLAPNKTVQPLIKDTKGNKARIR
jgi:nanoRNase/pAp phosphatase (c-di-AMP/oligoRNAs hydrolase)